MRQRGFTIIEMAVTLTVLAFVLFAAVPSIGTWMDNTRIRNAADALQSGIQTARSEAVRRNQTMSFWLVSDTNVLTDDCTLSNTSGSWVVSESSPEGNCADAPSTTVAPMIVTGRTVGEGGGHVAIAAVKADGTTAATQITFNGFGRIANTADAINRIDVASETDGSEARALRLVISPAGLVRMCDPAVSNSTDPRKCT
ncbi:MAG: GspH/FimT family pseudopilin [Aquabacterium sp.]|nr:GspH/FimT family pseudopilin [Aquabacterium sp.]